RRLVAPMNRFEDAVARELSTRVKARTRSVRALARWAAANLPPGALVADGVALVLDRLGGGDPDALAAHAMTAVPDRFPPNWGPGPGHWALWRTAHRAGDGRPRVPGLGHAMLAVEGGEP